MMKKAKPSYALLSVRRFVAAIAVILCASLGANADTTATYTTGDTSLEDGKVTFEYDGSGNITKLTMTPGADEKLILTGDELPFAAGAQIGFPLGGTNIISNPFTTAGALEFSGPTNMTWGGSDYLPNDGTYVTILENVNLANIVPVEGYGMNGGSAPTYGAEDNLYAPYFIVRDGDKMRFELRHDTRYVFVELVQDGDNIKGRVLLSGRGGTVSADSPIFNYNDGTVTVNGGVNTTYKPYAYEKQKWLVFSPRYGTPKLTFAVPCMTNMTWDAGNDWLPEGTDSTPVTLFENVYLSDIDPVAGYGRTGNNTPTQTDSYKYTPYFIERDGNKMRFELHWFSGNALRAAFIELVQDGDTIKGRALASGQKGNAVADDIERQLFTYNDNGTVTLTYISAYRNYELQKWLTIGARKVALPAISGSGVEVTFDSNALGDTVGEFTSDYPATVKATGRNDMDGAFIVKGDASHPIVYDVAAKYAMPKTIDCYGNATLNFSATGGYNDGVSRYTDTIAMHPGTTVTTAGNYPFHYNSGDVVLDGATLSYTTGTTYFNYVTFANGATVDKTGGAINAGYQVSNPKWTVSGTGLSTYTGDLSLAAHATGDNGSEKYLTIEVADTVEGDSTDFLLTGDITAWTDRKNASFIKTGAGTMEVDGTIYTTNRAVRVTEGTLLLSKSGATAAEVDFSLQGGTLALAAGTANTIDDVTLTADSIISVGAGASLTMASLTIPEGKTLGITFAGAVDSRSVKVSSALDSATLSRIRLNGKRARRSDAGYLYIGGFVISIF